MPDLKYITSPFFIFEFNNPKIKARDLHTNAIFKKISNRLIEIAHFCITAKLKKQIKSQGFSDQAIEAAISNGIICDSQSMEFKSADLWERHNWTRAAYLTFSQMNLNYLEKNSSEADILSLFDVRRNIVKSQLQNSKYPDYIRFNGEFIALKKSVTPKGVSADAIFKRNSVRSFEKTSISFDCFSTLLYDATDQIRALDIARKKSDFLQMFNSYFCWSIIFLVVQGVDGLENAVYHYDPVRHGLIKLNSYRSDQDIYSCIQYQKWISGGGFCLFLSSQWNRYYWIYRHSRAYINLLIQVGELGQEFFQSANYFGLGGWGTPAINESKAKKLLNIGEFSIDPLYFIKIGVPKEKCKQS